MTTKDMRILTAFITGKDSTAGSSGIGERHRGAVLRGRWETKADKNGRKKRVGK